MFITSWTIDIRMNIEIWLLYRRYKSEWYNFWWATKQDIAACACKVWTLFGQACGQEECSQTTTMTTLPPPPPTTTDKSWLHRLATDILSWAKKEIVQSCEYVGLSDLALQSSSSQVSSANTTQTVGNLNMYSSVSSESGNVEPMLDSSSHIPVNET